jgi:hypothetical protein
MHVIGPDFSDILTLGFNMHFKFRVLGHHDVSSNSSDVNNIGLVCCTNMAQLCSIYFFLCCLLSSVF